jgi:thymidylate synthase
MEQVKEQISRDPKPFPKIIIDDSVKTIADFTPDKVTLE